MLQKQDILNQKLPTTTVHVEEWGGDVLVRSLTAGEVEQWQKKAEQLQDDGIIMATFCQMVLVDELGNQLFQSDEIEALSSVSANALVTVFEAAAKHNGIDDGAIEEAKKN
jgi:hypothetical protein